MKTILKAIYNYLPFKREIFSVLKIIWIPEKQVFQHLHFKGTFTVSIDKSKKFKMIHPGFQIENEIFWKGLSNGWEKESLKLWIKLCKDSKTIIDIGANTGVYSLVAKTVNPQSTVYSFEPHPTFFTILKKNIILNNFDIIPYRKAISNHDGVIIIDDYSGHSASLSVDSLTADSFIKQNGIKKIDLIKIDVETHEPEVLEGFASHLSLFKPTMLIEILNSDIAEKVNNTVQGLGYLYFNINEKGSIRQTDRIEKSDYYNYLICNSHTASKIGLLNR